MLEHVLIHHINDLRNADQISDLWWAVHQVVFNLLQAGIERSWELYLQWSVRNIVLSAEPRSRLRITFRAKFSNWSP